MRSDGARYADQLESHLSLPGTSSPSGTTF
jgi:hypothetical protein